jgi:hypothetical protein
VFLQSQSHVTTDGQSVLVSSPLWGSWPDFLVLYSDYYGLCPLGVPSLTRGWICHLSEVFVMSLRIFTLLYTLYNTGYVQYVQGLCQSRLREADYALSYLTYAMTTASHLNCVSACQLILFWSYVPPNPPIRDRFFASQFKPRTAVEILPGTLRTQDNFKFSNLAAHSPPGSLQSAGHAVRRHRNGRSGPTALFCYTLVREKVRNTAN